MVIAPPRWETDYGRNATTEEGTVILGMETEKGKGIINPSNSFRYGEGSSGISKEEKKIMVQEGQDNAS